MCYGSCLVVTPRKRMYALNMTAATGALALFLTGASAWQGWADTTLNVSQVRAMLPERAAIYLGSPSVVRLADGTLVASHDMFGSGYKATTDVAFTYRSADEGQTWALAGSVDCMYWATLFTRPGDARVYLIGTTGDGAHGHAEQISIAASFDGAVTWGDSVSLTRSNVSYSTGVTSVLLHGGRIWRAFEHNVEPGWAAGYATVVISAPVDAPDLTDPAVWTLSGELAFSSVAHLIPPSWVHPLVKPGFGWLEGGTVEPVDPSDTGINVVLRVNSQPTANKAALVHLPAADAAPQFVGWLDFPGGMTKFTIRRDPATGLYVTLSNNIEDDSVTLPPACAPIAAPSAPAPCCGFLETCYTSSPGCWWCHAGSRNNLTLAVSPNLVNWTVVAPVLQDDTGVPTYTSLAGTGFQYVDWQFDNGSRDIVYAVRAGYRGSNNYHNANRILFGNLHNWSSTVRERHAELLMEEARKAY